MRMRHRSSVPCMVLLQYSTLSHKRQVFGRNSFSIKCVFWISLQILYVSFVIVTRTEQDANVLKSLCKVMVILFRFQWILNFLDRFSKKKTNYQLLWKPIQWIRVFPCGQTDVRTVGEREGSKVLVSFRNCANVPILTIFWRDIAR